MNEAQGWDPELGPMVAIPEPFWVRTPRTLFRWRPACYGHRLTFRTREQWERHWLTVHNTDAPREPAGDGTPTEGTEL